MDNKARSLRDPLAQGVVEIVIEDVAGVARHQGQGDFLQLRNLRTFLWQRRRRHQGIWTFPENKIFLLFFFFGLFVAFVDWLVIKNGAHETSSNNDVKVDRMHSHNNYTVINIFVYNCFSFMKRGMWL